MTYKVYKLKIDECADCPSSYFRENMGGVTGDLLCIDFNREKCPESDLPSWCPLDNLIHSNLDSEGESV